MRKSMIATLLAVTLLGAQATGSFAQNAPAGGMEGMPGMEAGGAKGAMPMGGMMMMMDMMMPMMASMPMGGAMPMAGGVMPMAGMDMGAMPAASATPAAVTGQAVPAGVEQKLDLLLTTLEAMTARLDALEAAAAAAAN